MREIKAKVNKKAKKKTKSIKFGKRVGQKDMSVIPSFVIL